MRRQLVSVIVVNYNGGDVLQDCLDSLSKIKYPNWELIVVDNGSTDGSPALVSNFRSPGVKVKIIKNKTNVGFAGANNQGYEAARGELILLLNNDTKVDPYLIAKLVDRINKDSSLAVVQPKVKIMSDPAILDSAGSFLTATGFLEHWGYLSKDGKEFDREKYIFSAKGACMLIRKEVIDKVGLFDSDYGSYMEETDFCWRVWLAGYKILYYPETFILHKVGFTSKRQNQVTVNYHSFKNRIATLIKNLSFGSLFSVFLPHIVLVAGLCVYYFLTLRFSQSAMVFNAVIWNVKNIGNTFAKRKKVQGEIRKVSDNEIFKYIKKPVDYKGMFSHFVRAEKMLGGKHSV